MSVLTRGSLAQRIHLAAGLVLFSFVATHFLNHALGVFGLEVMQEVQSWRQTVTRSLVGSLVLGAALAVHIVMALTKLARRSTYKLPVWEVLQIGTGLVIPFLLIPHLVNTRLAYEVFGLRDSYLYELLQLWPGKAWMFTLLLAVVWAHGCIGLHYWLRLTSLYRRLAPVLYFVAAALPISALAGFVAAGREARLEAFDAESLAEIKLETHWPSPSDFQSIDWYTINGRVLFAVLLAVVALVYVVRFIIQVSTPKIEVAYISGPRIRTPIGPTLLEISRQNGIPHASVCGGRARCSTCRVRIEAGGEALAPPGPTEQATLTSIAAPEGVRLACQIQPVAALTVIRVINPKLTAVAGAAREAGESQGVERTLAIMFLDVRGFTRMTEDRLPYDVVYLLNEFFAAAVQAIGAEGGWIDKYLGDGLMAVFGRETEPQNACRQALRAAKEIDLALDGVNRQLAGELGEPLKIGIGIHIGPLVLGRIGHGETAAMTVIGRTVNTASRLEAMTKQKGCQLIASATVVRMAGLDPDGLTSERVDVRGLTNPMRVVMLDKARDLDTGAFRRDQQRRRRRSRPAASPEPATPQLP